MITLEFWFGSWIQIPDQRTLQSCLEAMKDEALCTEGAQCTLRHSINHNASTPASVYAFVSSYLLIVGSQASIAAVIYMSDKMKVNATGRFAVHDLASTVNGTGTLSIAL